MISTKSLCTHHRLASLFRQSAKSRTLQKHLASLTSHSSSILVAQARQWAGHNFHFESHTLCMEMLRPNRLGNG
jgi:hypothetical protein